MTKQKGRHMKSTATVRSNFATLIEAKAKERGEDYTISEIAADTRLAVNTVKSYLRGGQLRFEGPVVAVLCQYLGCRIEDLLEIVDEGQSAGGKSTARD